MVTKADKWLMVIFLITAVSGIAVNIFFISSSGNQHVQITVDGQVIKTVPLREGYTEEIRLGGDSHYNIIEIQGSRVHIREADCPDQICVRSGWVSVPPQQIVCLPYRVVVKVVSDHPADVDDIVR